MFCMLGIPSFYILGPVAHLKKDLRASAVSPLRFSWISQPVLRRSGTTLPYWTSHTVNVCRRETEQADRCGGCRKRERVTEKANKKKHFSSHWGGSGLGESCFVLTSTCLTHRRLRHCSCCAQLAYACHFLPSMCKRKAEERGAVTHHAQGAVRQGAARGPSLTGNTHFLKGQNPLSNITHAA